MGLLTLSIFIEKTHRYGHRIGQMIGVALIGLGLLLFPVGREEGFIP